MPDIKDSRGRGWRNVYGREFLATPVWLWIAQRASGLLLGPLVLLHLWMPGAGASWVMALLLLVIAMHGYAGLRRVGLAQRVVRRWNALAVAWAGIVAVVGALVIAAFR